MLTKRPLPIVARTILGIFEEERGDPAAEPGSWFHYLAVTAPYLGLWTRLSPEKALLEKQ